MEAGHDAGSTNVRRAGTTRDPECYWFIDLRFLNPGRDWVPFRFGAFRERRDAPWRAYERGEQGGRTALD